MSCTDVCRAHTLLLYYCYKQTRGAFYNILYYVPVTGADSVVDVVVVVVVVVIKCHHCHCSRTCRLIIIVSDFKMCNNITEA